MIQELMLRPQPSFLQREVHRQRNVKWYVHIRPKPRIRIHGEYGSLKFMTAYRHMINGVENLVASSKSGSLKWLIEQYRKSSNDWTYQCATSRILFFSHIVDKASDKPFCVVNRKIIIASRDERAATPAQARNFLKAMNGLLKWVLKAKYVQDNLVIGVKAPKLTNYEGFIAWTEDDVAKYEKTWFVGTKEHVWLDVLLYTRLR